MTADTPVRLNRLTANTSRVPLECRQPDLGICLWSAAFTTLTLSVANMMCHARERSHVPRSKMWSCSKVNHFAKLKIATCLVGTLKILARIATCLATTSKVTSLMSMMSVNCWSWRGYSTTGAEATHTARTGAINFQQVISLRPPSRRHPSAPHHHGKGDHAMCGLMHRNQHGAVGAHLRCRSHSKQLL